MAKGADKVNIFISYSHKDKRWLAEFQKILKPLERTGKLIIWDDTRIRAGAKWREEIAHALSTADAAVLLVSPDFIASDFIAEHELPPLLEGAENRGVQVFWVAVSACPYEETDVARYQAANDPRRPLDKLRRSALNQELTSIARKIAVARQVAPEVIAEPEEWEQRQKALERSAPRAAIGVGRDSNAGATPEFVRLLVSCRPEEDYGLFLPVLGLQCKTTNLHPDGSALFDKPHFRIGLRELFPGAFTAKGGMSQDATRILLRFYNVPLGVRIAVPSLVEGTDRDLVICLVRGSDGNGNGGTRATNRRPQELTVSGGFAFAVYEVLIVDPRRANSVWVQVTARWVANTANNSPGTGTMQASACLAPLSAVYPRPAGSFLDTGVPTSVLAVVRCSTTLLFPFVTNQAGFETGIAISNTSADPMGTPNQAGPVHLYYFGTTRDGSPLTHQRSTSVAAGGQLTFTVSGGNSSASIAGAPGFQGYMFAICEFQHAVGYAWITNGFGEFPPWLAPT